ncbi:MAG: helix-turn-helix domain-containing protein, partial [Planctomycetota bacterium]
VRDIRQHVKEVIQVADVVDAVGLSRRSLERRFRRAFGRSVHGEIRRVHVEYISRMLVETKLPISQIASTLGHRSAKHVARYFQQEKRMSPSAYRRRFGHK